MRSATRALASLALAASASSAEVARAQAADSAPRRPDEDAVCLGFAFGGFTPKLDWEKAGHRPVHDSSTLAHAPQGRDWAADIVSKRDSALYLFPAWWPVGVMVRLSSRTPAPGDTVSGVAMALVARGDIEAPTARVKAWRVSCGGRPTSSMSPTSQRPSPADTARPAAERTRKKIPASTGTRPVTPGILRRSP